jgi:hypothetical protein
MAIADSVSELSRSTDPQQIVAKALALIGTATGASRIRIDSRASLNKPPQRYEWHAPTSAAPPEDAAGKLAQKPPFVIPVPTHGEPWGEMEIHDWRVERAHSPIDGETYKTLAAIVGAALARERDIGELADAARIIENSATILFRRRRALFDPVRIAKHQPLRLWRRGDPRQSAALSRTHPSRRSSEGHRRCRSRR